MPIQLHTSRLDKIIEKVRQQHPRRKNGPVNIESSLIDGVRELLEKTTYEKIPLLVYTLDSQQLLACIEIVAIDKETDTAQKAAYAAELRPRETMIPRAWFHLVRHYPNVFLEELLKKLINSKGSAPLQNNSKISNRSIHWLLNPELPKGIVKDYCAIDDSNDLDTFLRQHFLTEKERLYFSTWQTLLMSGRKEDIKRQFVVSILSIFSETIESITRMKMCQHYLNALENFPSWDEQILEYINSKWGQPKSLDGAKSDETRFWRGVNLTPKLNFNKWLMQKAIEEFFEGERADFWRHYLEQGHIISVEKILGGDGFMLDFESFGVIEFKNRGNAAYIYPKETFDYFRGKARFWNSDPAYFKDKAKTVSTIRFPEWDGRIHHGQRWRNRTKLRIDTLIRER